MKLIFIIFLYFLIKAYTGVTKTKKRTFLDNQQSTDIKKNCQECNNSIAYLCAEHQLKSNALRLIDLLDKAYADKIVIKCIFPGQCCWHDGNACHAVITALRKVPKQVKIISLYFANNYYSINLLFDT